MNRKPAKTPNKTEKRRPQSAQPKGDPDLEGTGPDRSREPDEKDSSPLKTVGGTPIVQRENG